MSKEKVYPVSKEAQSRAHIQKEEYETMYEASIKESEQFWTKKAQEFISWFHCYTVTAFIKLLPHYFFLRLDFTISLQKSLKKNKVLFVNVLSMKKVRRSDI